MFTLAIGTAFFLGSILMAWAAYFAMRAVCGKQVEAETQRLAGSVIAICAALHGLILALVFAQEIFTYQNVRDRLVQEATAVGDIYYDIRRYGTDAEAGVQAALSRYTRIVATEEWNSLAERAELSAEAWQMRDGVYLTLLDLVPETPRQASLREHMLRKIQFLAEARHERVNRARQGISVMFWFASGVGIVFVSMAYFGFPPNRRRLALLSLYGGFTGVVMFMIYALANPFAEPGRLTPIAFERLLVTEIGQAKDLSKPGG